MWKIDDVLKDVNTVVGVSGTFVCDEEGWLVAKSMPKVYDGATLAVACRTVAQTAAGLESTRPGKLTDMDFVYGDGRLLVKKFQGGSLCVLCIRNINVPLLNLTANVAVKKLSEMSPRGGPTPGGPKAAPER